MTLSNTNNFSRILVHGTYILLDSGELGEVGDSWTGTPSGFTIGALPVKWTGAEVFHGYITSNAKESTLYHHRGQRMILPSKKEGGNIGTETYTIN